MYSNRDLEKPFKSALNNFKVVLLTGYRHVGKSTSLLSGFDDFAYINLDDDNELLLANSDSKLFFKDRSFPLVIDNINNCLSLLKEIKYIIDKSNSNSQFILIGEKNNLLINSCIDIFKDDIRILELSSLSLREKYNLNFNNHFIPSDTYIKQRSKNIKEYKNIWEDIHRGSFPYLMNKKNNWQDYYRDFLNSYIEKDFRSVINVKDELKFKHFLISLAARASSTIVYKEIADDVGVDIKTIQKWIEIVVESGLIVLVDTYRNIYTKRAIKSPKLYFMDTGLICYLGGWYSSEQAKFGAMSKALFENFVASEIIKSYMNEGIEISNRIYYYREKGNKMIDLVIVDNKNIYPIEICNRASLDVNLLCNFKLIKCPKEYNVKKGTVLCRCEKIENIKENYKAVPINYI